MQKLQTACEGQSYYAVGIRPSYRSQQGIMILKNSHQQSKEELIAAGSDDKMTVQWIKPWSTEKWDASREANQPAKWIFMILAIAVLWREIFTSTTYSTILIVTFGLHIRFQALYGRLQKA